MNKLTRVRLKQNLGFLVEGSCVDVEEWDEHNWVLPISNKSGRTPLLFPKIVCEVFNPEADLDLKELLETYGITNEQNS